MNTGIGDAYNLAWKLALVERGIADASLLDSYQAERHPVGVQLLKTTDRLFSVIAGQNPLSRIARGRIAPVASRVVTRPSAPGDQAREADVLIDGEPAHLYQVLRGPHHTVLLFTGLDDDATAAAELCRLAERIEAAYPKLVRAWVISAERFADHPLVLGDPDRQVHRQYGISSASAFVVRPRQAREPSEASRG